MLVKVEEVGVKNPLPKINQQQIPQHGEKMELLLLNLLPGAMVLIQVGVTLLQSSQIQTGVPKMVPVKILVLAKVGVEEVALVPVLNAEKKVTWLENALILATMTELGEAEVEVVVVEIVHVSNVVKRVIFREIVLIQVKELVDLKIMEMTMKLKLSLLEV